MDGRRSLYLLRHADAGDPGAWHGDDDLRPLSDKGVRQAERMGRHLARIGFEPDAILTSPRLRARQTADVVATALGREVAEEPRLADGLSPSIVASLLADAGDPQRAVLVGHDPDFSELLATLTGASEVPMKKGALARLDLRGELAPGAATLRWLLPPELLPRG
jgi:phosphohistidine phosphatase SixA